MRCPSGDHDFPDEDTTGAHCHEHGVTLVHRGPPLAPDAPPSPCPCGCQAPEES